MKSTELSTCHSLITTFYRARHIIIPTSAAVVDWEFSLDSHYAADYNLFGGCWKIKHANILFARMRTREFRHKDIDFH